MIKPTMIYGVASMLPALLGFFFLPLYSKYLTTSEFGVIAAMGVLNSMFTIFSGLALDRAAFRFYYDSSELQVQKKILGTFFVGSVGFSLLFLGLLFLLRPLLVLSYPEIAFFPFYFLTMVTVTLGVCGNYVMGYLRMSEKPRSYLALVFLTVLIQGGLIFYYVMVKKDGALGQVFALLLSTVILLPIYAVIAYKNFTFKLDLQLLKQGVSFSWPFIPTLLIAFILNWSDSIFIAQYRSMSEVGHYAMAYKISMVFLLISGSFATAYQPIFFRKANEENQIKAKKDLYMIIQVASRSFIAVAFLLALFSEDIIRWLLDEKYKEIYRILRIILLSHLLSAIMGISSNMYYLQSKTSRLQLVVVSSAAVINLVLNYLFVPTFGMYGAAFATVLSMLVLTFVHYSFSKRYYFININWAKLAMLIGTLAFTIFLFQFFIEGRWFSLYIKILFVSLIVILILRNRSVQQLMCEFRST